MNESMNECVSFGFHCLYVALFLLLSDICFLCLCGFFELILSWNVKQARTFFRFLFPAFSFLLYRALSPSLFAHTHTHTYRRARTHTHTRAHTNTHITKKKLGVTHSYTLFTQLYTLNIPSPLISFFRIFNYILFLFWFFGFFSFCILSFLFFLFLYFVISLSGWNKYTLTRAHTHKIIRRKKK